VEVLSCIIRHITKRHNASCFVEQLILPNLRFIFKVSKSVMQVLYGFMLLFTISVFPLAFLHVIHSIPFGVFTNTPWKIDHLLSKKLPTF
jgi:hypothetical protein